MLEGTLEPEMAKAWAWDRELNQNPDGDMWPQREMKDLLQGGERSAIKSPYRCITM
jgi:hypothetical protein